ncbi:pyrimidine operon attenuation protein / uracil phosphoribosyltransferase [Phycisphaerales bacterium]|nr:pyrimidine operon attenuation protein / uracil phosphoribosyltransferase [Phycisphaerales bacterium]
MHDPVVLAIPRGGVEIGVVIARELGAEVDVVLSRKLRAPHQPELAIGAVCEDGNVYLDADREMLWGDEGDYLERERLYQLSEIERRRRLFRGERIGAALKDRTVIVTDDGVATGATLIAALRAVRKKGPRELIVAVPVSPRDTAEILRRHCDLLVCPEVRDDFVAVGQFYRAYREVTDQRVVELLRECDRSTPVVMMPRPGARR